ncbi:agmatinase family protein [Pleomorphovibrio marinus]|uniref:agmatinase family protein n=1 Tax=Pleomorphovibrio marinus TaxID=2164132 RepID=UPI000E0C3C3C|nr:agmatinase family protein [Pleomorphovibrio marinus]
MTNIEKEKQLLQFDPNAVSEKGKFFGLPFNVDTAELIIIPVPWEVTVSYSSGTAKAPAAISEASSQVDLLQEDIKDAWKMGMAMLPVPERLKEENRKFRKLASSYINWLEKGSPVRDLERFGAVPDIINQANREMNQWVKDQALEHLENGKMLGLLGGDHSTPLGLVQAMATKHPSFGILQIDAHADLRKAYEDFEFSHASVALNWMKIPQVEKMTIVGLRDYCDQENEIIRSGGKVKAFTDQWLKEKMYDGANWKQCCEEIIGSLPQKVYLSVDIDGLDPKFCPNTGTPVPGGLQFGELTYLVKELVKSGREIIGFDLVEVCPGPEPDEWDANVGARLLYKLSNYMGVSQGKLNWS